MNEKINETTILSSIESSFSLNRYVERLLPGRIRRPYIIREAENILVTLILLQDMAGHFVISFVSIKFPLTIW